MLMVTSRLPSFIQPVVILRGRKLSFKQFDNGTVVIGGGHLAVPYRDEPHGDRLDQARDSATSAHGVGAVPGDARGPPSCAPGPASTRSIRRRPARCGRACGCPG